MRDSYPSGFAADDEVDPVERMEAKWIEEIESDFRKLRFEDIPKPNVDLKDDRDDDSDDDLEAPEEGFDDSADRLNAEDFDDVGDDFGGGGKAGEGDVPAKDDAGTEVSTRGRPRAMDEFDRGRVCSLLASGASQRQAAAMVGCSQPTISRAIKEDPKFAAEVEEAKQKAQMMPLLQIATAGRTSWRAAVWLLEYLEKRQQKEEFNHAEFFAEVDKMHAESKRRKENGS